jgi:hypothetical protein
VTEAANAPPAGGARITLGTTEAKNGVQAPALNVGCLRIHDFWPHSGVSARIKEIACPAALKDDRAASGALV